MSSQNSLLEPEVKVTLGGKTRTMRIDFNALALMEERTGKSIMSMGDWKNLKTKDIISLIWCALIHEDPMLTEKEVGANLTFANMTPIMQEFAKCMAISMTGKLPEPVEPQSPLPETPPEEINQQ